LSLVNIEPFDAYLFRVAGAITLSIAVVGLIASAFVPMAYCRFGCPTGAMLNLFILGGSRGGLIKRDYAVFFLLALALLCRFIA
jgi:NosR/NirI family nitrous oxide reductase transcriptional regulator